MKPKRKHKKVSDIIKILEKMPQDANVVMYLDYEMVNIPIYDIREIKERPETMCDHWNIGDVVINHYC